MSEYAYRRPTGIQYKSEGERKIAKFLADYDLDFVYEHPLLVMDYGRPRIWYPDFVLPEYATIIEYFGGVGDEDYDRGVFRKRKAYSELYLNLVSMFPQSFEDDWQGGVIRRIGENLEARLGKLYEKVRIKTAGSESYARNQQRTYSV